MKSILERMEQLLEVTPKIGMASNFRDELKQKLAKETVGEKEAIESYGMFLRFIDQALHNGKLNEEEHRLLHSTIAEIRKDEEDHLRNLNMLWEKFVGHIKEVE